MSSLSEDPSCLCGVSLATETSVFDELEDVCLGCVLLSSQCQSLTVTRRALTEQILNLPTHFLFLSSRGWQIQRDHECDLLLSDVVNSELTIRIKADFDKPRVGVWLRTGLNSSAPQGFVFITLNSSLQQLREAIRDQLGDITPVGEYHHHYHNLFNFLDSNGWPINSEQEVHFRVLDLLTHASVHVFFKPTSIIPSVVFDADTVDGFKSPLPAPSLHPPLSRESTTTTRSSGGSWPVKPDAGLDEMLDAKQILISYVRAEASEQALNLKRKLTSMGYSVFLDVHEIKSGIDWQDSLNFAVRHCDVFVPLVTARYGETQWTNREVKLADVLRKLILPVSFVEEWPPQVLAIQWATMQFIPWKPDKTVQRLKKHGKLDRSVWELDHVHKVAQQIVERLDGCCKAGDGGCYPHPKLKVEKLFRLEGSYKERGGGSYSHPKTQLQKLFSCPAPLPDDFSYLSQNRKGRSLVVVSAHPHQTHFVQELRELFAGGDIELWSSIELDHDDSRSDVQLFSQESLRERILSGESEGPPVIASQLSDTSMDSEFLHKNNQFQEKADEAGVILVVLSKEFARSKTCMQQIFYCEHRKKLIPIKYEDFGMPGWMSVLIGTGELEDRHSPNYKELLKERVEDYLQGKTHLDKDVQRENTISIQANVLQAKLKKKGREVIYAYISGGARFYNDTSKEICRHIGQCLADNSDLCLVTGGFPGVGDKVARAYLEAREKLGKKDRTVLHILPKKDPKVFKPGMQTEDRMFREVSYGDTIFSGESVRDRESIVSRVFDICILIEGGPGAAHEAEQFEWNDRIVIPVRCTGGAAGGKFDVPNKIFEIPVGVSERDWNILQDKETASSSALIGRAVANVVSSITDNILLSRSQQNSPQAIGSKKGKSLRVKFPSDITTNPLTLMSPGVGSKNVSFSKGMMRSHSREAPVNGNLPFKQRFRRQESIAKNKITGVPDMQRSDTLILEDQNNSSSSRTGIYKLNEKIRWASESPEEINVPVTVVQDLEAPMSVVVKGNEVIATSSPIPENVSQEFSIHSQSSQSWENGVDHFDGNAIKMDSLNSEKSISSLDQDEGIVFLAGSVEEVKTAGSLSVTVASSLSHQDSRAAGDSFTVNGGGACCSDKKIGDKMAARNGDKMAARNGDKMAARNGEVTTQEAMEEDTAPSKKRTRHTLMKVKLGGERGDSRKKDTAEHTDSVVVQVKSKRKLAL